MRNYNASRWHNGEDSAFAIGIVIGIMASGFVYNSFGLTGLCAAPFLIVIGFVLVTEIHKRIEKRLWKDYYINTQTTLRIVQNILNEKGIPYQLNQTTFRLEDTNLTIEIRPYYAQKRVRRLLGGLIISGFNPFFADGSSIIFNRNTSENQPLIKTLCEKIDEALLPKGLV